MSVLSKLLWKEYSLPYNCYELGHTWTPYCSESSLFVAENVFKESIKMYSFLYFLTQFILKKYHLKNFLTTLKSILRSSCFLCFNAWSTLFLFCFLRRISGKFHLLMFGHLPAILSSFLALKIERKSRRSALAFYCTIIAMETILFSKVNIQNNQILNIRKILSTKKALFHTSVYQNLGVSKLITTQKSSLSQNFLIRFLQENQLNLIQYLMTTFGICSLFYLIKLKSKHGKQIKSKTEQAQPQPHSDLISFAIKYLIGNSDFEQTPHDNHNLKNNKLQIEYENTFGFSKAKTYFSILFNNYHKSSVNCFSHTNFHPCIKSCGKSSLRGFVIGFLCSFTLNLTFNFKNFKLKKPIWLLLKNKENFKFAAFISSFNGFYKLSRCWLHKKTLRHDALNTSLAAFLGLLLPKILFNKFISQPNLNMCQYIFWKAIENWFWHFAELHQTKHNDLNEKFTKILINIFLNKNEKSNLNYTSLDITLKDVNKYFTQEINDKTKKLSVNDVIYIKYLSEKLAYKEAKKNFSVFHYISADNLICLLYSLSVSQLFYVAVMEPQKLRASYMNFLNRFTHNRLSLLNRKVIDLFGVNSSKGYESFEPQLDLNFTTNKFQETILVWKLI